MNLEQLQEENIEKTFLLEQDGVPLQDIVDLITTTSYQAGALAVIEELRKVPYGTNGNGQKWVMVKDLETYLTTLEAKLKDNK